MSVDKDIEKTAKKLEALKIKRANMQKTVAIQFFKKNKIEYLLQMPEELKAFSEEITEVIKKEKKKKIVTEEQVKEDVQNEWN